MILSISDSNPYVMFIDDYGEPCQVSIIEDEAEVENDKLYNKLMNMPDKDLKKYLAENKSNLKNIHKIINSRDQSKNLLEGGKKLKLTNKSVKILPRKDRGREILYIFGPSGSGKSVFCANYAKAYSMMHPDDKIYLFSKLSDDESIDVIDPIRIPMDLESLAGLDISDLENSLCIFDDTDSESTNKLTKALDKIRGDILEEGRHFCISCLITTHMACNYKKTRSVLNETHRIVIFPQSGSSHQNEYLLKHYGGLKKDKINEIMELPSRWVSISTNAPKHITHENGIFLL